MIDQDRGVESVKIQHLSSKSPCLHLNYSNSNLHNNSSKDHHRIPWYKASCQTTLVDQKVQSTKMEAVKDPGIDKEGHLVLWTRFREVIQVDRSHDLDNQKCRCPREPKSIKLILWIYSNKIIRSHHHNKLANNHSISSFIHNLKLRLTTIIVRAEDAQIHKAILGDLGLHLKEEIAFSINQPIRIWSLKTVLEKREVWVNLGYLDQITEDSVTIEPWIKQCPPRCKEMTRTWHQLCHSNSRTNSMTALVTKISVMIHLRDLSALTKCHKVQI